MTDLSSIIPSYTINANQFDKTLNIIGSGPPRIELKNFSFPHRRPRLQFNGVGRAAWRDNDPKVFLLGLMVQDQQLPRRPRPGQGPKRFGDQSQAGPHWPDPTQRRARLRKRVQRKPVSPNTFNKLDNWNINYTCNINFVNCFTCKTYCGVWKDVRIMSFKLCFCLPLQSVPASH